MKKEALLFASIFLITICLRNVSATDQIIFGDFSAEENDTVNIRISDYQFAVFANNAQEGEQDSLQIYYARIGNQSLINWYGVGFDSLLINYSNSHYKCHSNGHLEESIGAGMPNEIRFVTNIICTDEQDKIYYGDFYAKLKVNSSCRKTWQLCSSTKIGNPSLNFIAWWIEEFPINQPIDYEQRISSLEASQESQNQDISALESWKQTIDSWKTTVTTTLSGIATSITSLLGTTNNHETRITSLENQNFTQQNITIQDYWKYLGSSDRKNIVCGIAKDNHMTYLIIEDLGYECTVTYRQTPSGERASCRCNRL